MKKITKLYRPREDKNIFTEGINYFKTGKNSIWGFGDLDTLKILRKLKLKGKWLNLAAGDGRYNSELLKKVDLVVASDIDKSALSKLWYNTQESYRKKLDLKALNIINKLPFKDKSFEGVFCTGTLHLFQREILEKISLEINRILKPNGIVIIDFATDVKRISPEGKSITFGKEPLYNLKSARKILRSLFKGYKIKMYSSSVSENYPLASPPYFFNCKYVLAIAKKSDKI